MKAYTIECPGRLVPGIVLTDGGIDVGARAGDGKVVRVPCDPRATIDGSMLVASPGRGALVLLRDQAGVFGSWHLRAAQPDKRWDAMVTADAIPNALDRILAQERIRARYPHRAPIGWYEFARGATMPQPYAEGARMNATLYGYLEDGAAFEIRRRGRLEGTPSVYLVSCRGDEVTVTDPRAAAKMRAASRRVP